jgi:hypothetical protein
VPSVAVIVPWRGGNPYRERHHRVVREHLRAMLPDALHLDADSGHQIFSRAGSRNHGVRQARARGADVVVLVDADTLPESEPLFAAIDQATADGLLHLPYTRYRSLTRNGTRNHLRRGVPAIDCEADHDHKWATGGVLAITPTAWVQAGGMDERFTGWGFEDVAFRAACDTLLGDTVKHEGTITHLWHPAETALGSPQHVANAALCKRYLDAQALGTAQDMRDLTSEWTSPLTSVLPN